MFKAIEFGRRLPAAFRQPSVPGSRASPRTDRAATEARADSRFHGNDGVGPMAVRLVREAHHERGRTAQVELGPCSWFERLTTGGSRGSPRADVPHAPAQSVPMVREPHHERTFHPPPPSRSNGSRGSPRADVPHAPAQSVPMVREPHHERTFHPPPPSRSIWFESLTMNGRSTCPRQSVQMVREPRHRWFESRSIIPRCLKL